MEFQGVNGVIGVLKCQRVPELAWCDGFPVQFGADGIPAWCGRCFLFVFWGVSGEYGVIFGQSLIWCFNGVGLLILWLSKFLCVRFIIGVYGCGLVVRSDVWSSDFRRQKVYYFWCGGSWFMYWC
ncbi:unnamed protein product [Amaranthus hypochondriacus]